ncbi:MAG TPA: hypothetical protein VG603_00520, partial [Chitinophagales bacterium]|nr:hypothetical protein [Chitinophagales bacterium]
TANIKIFNNLGQLMLGFDTQLEAGVNTLPLNVAQWAAGAYHAAVHIGGKTLKLSFLVQAAKH